MNTPRLCISETKKAFRQLMKREDLLSAIQALCNLKGVGPAMASSKCIRYVHLILHCPILWGALLEMPPLFPVMIFPFSAFSPLLANSPVLIHSFISEFHWWSLLVMFSIWPFLIYFLIILTHSHHMFWPSPVTTCHSFSHSFAGMPHSNPHTLLYVLHPILTPYVLLIYTVHFYSTKCNCCITFHAHNCLLDITVGRIFQFHI